jgi:hypothetical protein
VDLHALHTSMYRLYLGTGIYGDFLSPVLWKPSLHALDL